MASVSVHIVTYNNAATIETCLRALLAQTQVDFTVMVIDNASSDDTVDRVERLGVSVQRNARNLGYAAAHNQAINATESDYILTLNPDVALAPDFLAQMVKVMDARPDVGSAAGCLFRVNDLQEAPSVMDGTGVFMRRTRRQYLRDDGVPVDKRTSVSTSIFGPDGAAAFYRRAMLDDIRVDGEVFDSDFFMHKEDIDVCWRAQLRGWSALYVPEAQAKHIRTFRPGQRASVSDDVRFYGVRNRFLLMLKNESSPHLVRDLPWIVGYDLAVLAYILLRERQSLSAYGSAWQLRHRMLQKRRLIQTGRRVDWRALRPYFL